MDHITRDSKGIDFSSIVDAAGNIHPRFLSSCAPKDFPKDIIYKSLIDQGEIRFLKRDEILGHFFAEVNWLELPMDLLSLIADKFVLIKDLVRFGAVCSIWQSIYLKKIHSLPRQPPLLMLPSTHNDQIRTLYDLSEKKMWNSQLQVPQDSFCQGSCFGWLLMVTRSFQVSLLNPFLPSNNQIQLPPLTAFDYEEDDELHVSYIAKAVLSANPTHDPNYTVFVIHGHRFILAFLKPGDKKWTNLNLKYKAIFDVLHHGDYFYAVDHVGKVFAIDLHRPLPKVSVISPRHHNTSSSVKKYLVECCGDLLLVLKFRDWQAPSNERWVEEDYFTTGFKVFKLDRKSRKWLEMKSLNNNIFFLGDNSSISISASCFPECKPNSIYFTDDYHEGYYSRYYDNFLNERGAHDMGVFSLEDGSIEPHYPMSEDEILPPPVWIELPQ